MPCDRVHTIARPLENVITASVARNGGMRRRATARPLARPMARPTASMAAMPAAALPGKTPPLSVITFAPATLASAIVAVTERSIPPATRTSVWPSDTARRGRKLDSTLPRLPAERNPGTNGASARR